MTTLQAILFVLLFLSLLYFVILQVANIHHILKMKKEKKDHEKNA